MEKDAEPEEKKMEKVNRKHNLRDLGGFSAKDNKVIREGFILRSGSLFNLSKADAKRLERYGVKLVIDLRAPLEIEEKPDGIIPGAKYIQTPFMTNETMGITHQSGSDPITIVRKLRKDKNALHAMMPDMETLYLNMVTNQETQQQIGNALNAVIDSVLANEAVLFHCTEGKDRTGILAAIILNILGVSRNLVLKDYIKTNQSVYPKAVKKGCMVGALTHSFSIGLATYQLYMAQQRHLIKTMSTIRKRYDNIDNYAILALGADPEKLKLFKQKMCMPDKNL